ncbi:hypothetical protein [Burkholderia anthina]|uniref:hypothetical protein n=1 Tax=Burkholderia anthina TaxID=179879 RepID=UPI0037C02B86
MAANPRCVSTAWVKIEITHGKSPRKSSRTSSGPAFIELEGNARQLAPRHSGFDATRLQAGTSANANSVRICVASYTTAAPDAEPDGRQPAPGLAASFLPLLNLHVVSSGSVTKK